MSGDKSKPTHGTSGDKSKPAHGTSGDRCIYSTVGHSINTPEAPQPEQCVQASHPYRLAAVCLGLLCALLLASTLVLGVLFHTQDLKDPKCVSKERALEELRDDFSRGTEAERKANMAFLAMLEKKYTYLEKYCPFSSKKDRKCKPCPQGWEQYSSKCYYFSTEEKDWFESQSYCLQQGAGLVIIESEAEQEFIANNTSEYPYWIGLTDSETEGTWVWKDKTSLQKGFWRSGEPDDHYWPKNKTQEKVKEADCVVTVPNENTWEDTRCFSMHNFVCETDALLLNSQS